jgi:hypothetical protein
MGRASSRRWTSVGFGGKARVPVILRELHPFLGGSSDFFRWAQRRECVSGCHNLRLEFIHISRGNIAARRLSAT